MQAYTCTTDLYVDGKLSKLVISLAVNKKLPFLFLGVNM